ncbi:MAG: hypothetical protein ABIR68_06670, partial [Ilumatobacteraceae bacterium]
MSDPMKQAWNEVAENFSQLGKVMKHRYQDSSADSAAEADHADAGVRAAFERLLAAGRELGDRIADVVAGDDVRAQARQTGQRLNDAVTTTADTLGEQLRGVYKGAGRRSDPVDTVAEDAPSESPGVGSTRSGAGTGGAASEPDLPDDQAG